MAKNRLFGWMFVEDSNKESETGTDAIRQTAAFANYVKQVEQVMSETHE